MSLIAVVSSLLPALVSTRQVGDAAGVTLLVVMLMVPLWAITVTEWPLPLRRVQAAIASLIGIVAVGLDATSSRLSISGTSARRTGPRSSPSPFSRRPHCASCPPGCSSERG